MSGTPTEAEVIAQWKAAVDLLENTRNYADGTVAPAAGLLDVLEQSLEGNYTPDALAGAGRRFRAGLSSLVSPARVQEFLTPLLFEYGGVIGSGYRDTSRLMRALYEYMADGSVRVESRAITYDTSATAGAGNVGNGTMTRLTEDENGFNLEACHVETKLWRCRADQNSGTLEHAESWEHLGEDPSRDSLLRASYGSGVNARAFIRSRHAGAGAGGSLLRNSSFSTYDASGTPKFVGWTETSGSANIGQDTTNFYRSHPGASVDGSLQLSGDALIKQTLASMRVSRLDPDRPYFFRVMVNPTVGSASGGSLVIRMGSQSTTLAVASMSVGWQEVIIAADQNTWFRNFNEDPFDVEIEWTGSSSGSLLVDDAIFTPYDLVDGTYWLLRGGTTPWLLDDTLEFTDTGGAPSTGKIQWYLWMSGLGYLPSATPAVTFTDP